MGRPQKGMAWVILDAKTNKMLIFEGQCLVYWRRRVAQDAANDYGLTWHGPDSDARIQRCVIKAL